MRQIYWSGKRSTSGIRSTCEFYMNGLSLRDNVLTTSRTDTSMKLDKDLVREILLAVEASEEDPLGWTELNLEGREALDVSYHVMLLHEAGLLVGQDLSADEGLEWLPKRLTYKGHEFLDTVRDGEVWELTKTGAEKVGSASLGLLFELGKAYGKQVLKDRLGIELP